MSTPVTNAVQNPSSPVLVLGFGADTISVMVRETHNEEDTANIEYVPSETGDDAVAVVSNPGKRITVDGYLVSGVAVPRKGDAVTLGSDKYMVESRQIRRTRTTARISMTLYKPDNTTWDAAATAGATTVGAS